LKDLKALWSELARECASWCGTSAERDIKTVALRTEAEGESFFTISLPRFAKALEKGLDDGALDYALFAGFKRRGGLPEFLRGFLSQIFSPSGTLLDEPSIDCIKSVRELTLLAGKMKRMCSDARVASAMRSYVELEKELQQLAKSSGPENLFPDFLQAALLLFGDVFAHVENSILDRHHLADTWTSSNDTEDESYLSGRKSRPGVRLQGSVDLSPMDVILGIDHIRKGGSKPLVSGLDFFGRKPGESFGDCEIVDPASRKNLVPRHGPGATADRVRGNAKFSVRNWPQRLEDVFPYGDYALPQLALENELDRVHFLEPGSEVPAKVTTVPKTDKNPRLIAEEPTAVQYMQQALFRQVIYRLENAVEFPPPLGGKEFDLGKWFVGFRDQEPNRLLARKGSLDGDLATLDLSEASDRVLNAHVKLLLSRHPVLLRAVQATRSTHADVPGHGVIPLAKFSSMGSALCFPMEAMVFTTIVIVAIAHQRGVSVNRGLLHGLRGKVRVYGDDIIVPVDCVQRVIQYLEAFGLKVNFDKSFWNGKFRESCGGDYYAGELVTPTRLRHELPRSLADVDGVVGLVAFRNLLYFEGYWETARKIDDRLQVLFKGRWKIGDTTSSGLVRHSCCFSYEEEWQDDELHDPRISGVAVFRPIPESTTTGSGSLMKFLIKPGITPSQDPKHLERQGRPVESRIKLRGIRPY
jgi:hypothetical protein